jgi:hypothetical protein
VREGQRGKGEAEEKAEPCEHNTGKYRRF